MRAISETAPEEGSTGITDLIFRVLMAFRRSFLLFTGGIGVLFVLAAQFLLKGVQAAIVGIFGLTFLAICGFGFLAYWLLRNVYR